MFKFKHPFTCLIAGPTQSGKTFFTVDFLTNIKKMIEPIPTKVLWCYGAYQEKFKELPDFVEISEGFSAIDDVDGSEPTLVILDDLMQEAGNAKEIANLFTKGSHHKNMSVVMIVQNLFHQGKTMRTISLNAHYLILFKNPRDASQIRYLANQLFPGQTNFLVEAYKQATSRPHGYLVLDLTQSTVDERRVLSDILPNEEGFYYIAK